MGYKESTQRLDCQKLKSDLIFLGDINVAMIFSDAKLRNMILSIEKK